MKCDLRERIICQAESVFMLFLLRNEWLNEFLNSYLHSFIANTKITKFVFRIKGSLHSMRLPWQSRRNKRETFSTSNELSNTYNMKPSSYRVSAL